MENKELHIKNIQQNIGWVYQDLKWLTEKEAKLANKKRDELLRTLSGKVSYSFMQNKLHIGKLSPGCLICAGGYWSCLFINGLCTTHCFYCPQDRAIKKERPPMDGDIIFDSPQDYCDYLEKFNFKGVGFTGGETFLVFEKLLAYIRKIKERFGKKIYLWIYTNGDLVNIDKLKKLKESGLDEIRFNISARNYDLRPVELATNIIKAVAVEIPCIPEDDKIVKKSLVKIQKMGVKYLNLHQLCTTQYNYKNHIRRGYTFLHHPAVPVLESEMVALKIIKYALDNKISLPISYCSSIYKARLQGKGLRLRLAPLVKDDFEEITDSGFIRNLSIQDSSVNISYFNPELKMAPGSNETGKEIMLNSHKKIFIKKGVVAQHKGLSPIAIKSFQKLFIENKNEKEALDYFYRNYNLKTKEDLNKMKKEIETLIGFKTWEHIEAGIPEIY